MGPQKIPSRGHYVFKLFLPHWVKFEETGKYTVTARRTLQLSRATGKAFEVIATALKGSGDRQSTALQGFQSQLDEMKVQEMAEIRKELKSITALFIKQGAALEALSRKKGFSF